MGGFYIVFVIVAFSLAVRGGLQLDYADVPAPCVDTCRPVAELSGICDVDADFDDNNEELEDLMKLQCLCTNRSFNVQGATALCASCIDQMGLPSDKDDNMDDISEIMARCGFMSMIWTPKATKIVHGVDHTLLLLGRPLRLAVDNRNEINTESMDTVKHRLPLAPNFVIYSAPGYAAATV